MQPLNVRRRAVEPGEVDLHAEHPPHKREQPRMLSPATLNLDGERSWIRLAYAYDRELGHVPEQPDICSLWTEHIDQIGRQPTQDIDGEVEAVRRSDRNGVAAFGQFVCRPGLDRAGLSHDFTMPA